MSKPFDSQFLNDCLNAYIRTYTVDERLREFIQKSAYKDEEREVVRTVDALVRSATDYIYDFKSDKRIEWNPDFEKEHFEFISKKHEWLSSKGYERIRAYCSWLCWHDGL